MKVMKRRKYNSGKKRKKEEFQGISEFKAKARRRDWRKRLQNALASKGRT